MALTENGNDLVMPVQPMYGGYGNGGGFGGFGGDWGSLIVLFLICAMFGGFGGFGGGFGGGFDGAFPWLMTGQAGINANTNAGFDNAAIAGQLNGIQSAITSGFASAEVANCGRASDAMQTAYTNQIASMNQNFANQQALDARLGSMEMAQQNCCCENKAAVADLKYTVAQEACADRNAIQNALRDVLTAQTAGIQSIKDQLCQDKIDAKNEQIQALQAQVNMQALAASQASQTAQLIADNSAQTQYIVNRVAPYPIPAYPVSAPFGYGCGYGNGYGYGFNPFGNVGFGNGSF